MNQRIRRKSIKRIKIRRKIESIRSTSIVIKIGAKTKTRKGKRTKLGNMIQESTTPKSIMKRFDF